MLRLVVFSFTLLLMPLPSIAAQQQPPLLEPGARVRITAPGLGIERQAATFEAWQGDTLVVSEGSTMDCPLSSIARLEVQRGWKSRAGKGAMYGAVVGVLVGLGLGAIAANDCSKTAEGCAALVPVGGAVVGVVGTGVGAGIGAHRKIERWEDIPLDQLSLQIAPRPDGRFGFGASIRF